MNVENTPPLETGRSFVSVWECDEIGHYNVQFYMARKAEADAHLRLALGLPPTNRQGDAVWVRVEEDHVRYHGELRAVDTLVLHSGITALDETSLTVLHEMRNALTGVLSATFMTRWTHLAPSADGADAQPAPWPGAVRSAAEKIRVDISQDAQKFSTGMHGPVPDLSLTQARGEGLALTHRGLAQPFMTDAEGRLTAQAVTAISSDAAAHLWSAFGCDWTDLTRRGLGTVVLESLTRYRRPLRAGDAALTLSYTRTLSAKTLGFGHLLFNAGTGALSAAIEVTAVVFDLKARRVTPLDLKDPARFDALKPSFVQG